MEIEPKEVNHDEGKNHDQPLWKQALNALNLK
jgi:hypothetical protein